jgi:hypothetical protein
LDRTVGIQEMSMESEMHHQSAQKLVGHDCHLQFCVSYCKLM